MKKLFGVLLVLSACSSTPKPAPGDLTDFRALLASENFKLRKKLGERKFKSGFLAMKEEDYFQAISPELKAHILAFEEHKFVAFDAGFVVCVKSETEAVAICDNSNTPGIDRIKVIKPLPDLDQLANETFMP